MKKYFFKAATILRKVGRKLDRKNKDWYKLLYKWKVENAKHNYRISYPSLGHDSIVFDLGGFEGDWSSDIYSKYLCQIYLFEPVPTYAKQIKKRFRLNEKIIIHQFGLGDRDFNTQFSIGAESSSQYIKSSEMVDVSIQDIKKFILNNAIDKIHLMKINIEGGEYDLLEYMIQSDLILRVENLQIQFHHFIPNAKKRMKKIQVALQNTHEITYQYEFLWENWKLKK